VPNGCLVEDVINPQLVDYEQAGAG
jgi:hypothetical protein